MKCVIFQVVPGGNKVALRDVEIFHLSVCVVTYLIITITGWSELYLLGLDGDLISSYSSYFTKFCFLWFLCWINQTDSGKIPCKKTQSLMNNCLFLKIPIVTLNWCALHNPQSYLHCYMPCTHLLHSMKIKGMHLIQFLTYVVNNKLNIYSLNDIMDNKCPVYQHSDNYYMIHILLYLITGVISWSLCFEGWGRDKDKVRDNVRWHKWRTYSICHRTEQSTWGGTISRVIWERHPVANQRNDENMPEEV